MTLEYQGSAQAVADEWSRQERMNQLPIQGPPGLGTAYSSLPSCWASLEDCQSKWKNEYQCISMEKLKVRKLHYPGAVLKTGMFDCIESSEDGEAS